MYVQFVHDLLQTLDMKLEPWFNCNSLGSPKVVKNISDLSVPSHDIPQWDSLWKMGRSTYDGEKILIS